MFVSLSCLPFLFTSPFQSSSPMFFFLIPSLSRFSHSPFSSSSFSFFFIISSLSPALFSLYLSLYIPAPAADIMMIFSGHVPDAGYPEFSSSCVFFSFVLPLSSLGC
uniref:Uncharacterized protein n=1 Tax=Cacopsylla melanoneura TaxID=428564 RepID=A0A8D8XD87_9HEMI